MHRAARCGAARWSRSAVAARRPWRKPRRAHADDRRRRTRRRRRATQDDRRRVHVASVDAGLSRPHRRRSTAPGPTLNSVIELNPGRARTTPTGSTPNAPPANVRGPLHGIPVLLKDNIDVVGMVNSAGSLALADNRPQQDAFLVARLRAAGAVILGKTNLSEWANFRSTHSTSGWSSRGGQTRNPYVLDRNPCGSSAGTGAAIAASLATVGVGTETDGSIICPAAINGLVGLKPTVGLVSRRGIIPISVSQDTAGPMGRTVADVAALLNVLAAVDDADPAGRAGEVACRARLHRVPEPRCARRANASASCAQALGFNADVDAAMERAVATMTAAGAIVIDVKIDGYGSWEGPELDRAAVRVQRRHQRVSEIAPASNPRSLDELIAWNQRPSRHRDAVVRPGACSRWRRPKDR